MIRTSEPPPPPKLINHSDPNYRSTNNYNVHNNSKPQAFNELYLNLNATKTTFAERVQNRAKTASSSTQIINNTSQQAISLRNANIQLDEHRKRNGPEKYMDAMKVVDMRKWLETVDMVQSVEGKCLETISKILFYND